MTAAFESGLLTPEQTGAQICKTPAAVRRLVKLGKLEALKEGGRLLIKSESVDAYISQLSHPMPLMAALYLARDVLAQERYILESSPSLFAQGYQHALGSPYLSRFLPAAVPVARELLAALTVRDYRRAEGQAAELGRVHTDYAMLHAPIEAEQLALFGSSP